MYKSLNDASCVDSSFENGDVEIWYQNIRKLIHSSCAFTPDIPVNIENLNKTHIHLGNIKESDLETAFRKLQGDYWSPNGEARELIIEKKLQHTSMSVGDIIKKDGKVYIVDMVGFKEIKKGD